MCGIVAVLARPSLRTPPDPGAIDATFALAAQELTPLGGQYHRTSQRSGANGADAAAQLSALWAATAALRALDASLRGVPGLTCLLGSPSAVDALERGTAQMDALAAGLEVALDTGHFKMGTSELEEFNAALVKFRDVIWALGRDRLEAARSVAALGTHWASTSVRPERGASSGRRSGRPVGRPRRPQVARPSRGAGPRLGRPAPHAGRPRPGSRAPRRSGP